MTVKIISEIVANVPWQDKPAGCEDVVWRYSENPVVSRHAIKSAHSIYNSAVVPFGGGFAGVFRIDNKVREMRLHAGRSKDGITWEIEDHPIVLEEHKGLGAFEYGYDPRVTRIDDKYYLTWCNGYKGAPTIGVAYTADFKTFHQLENAFLPFNRNGVLFPRKINGHYAMLSRPSDNGHTPFGDIYYSESPDMCFWGRHRHVMSPSAGWQNSKVGAGSIPIETSEGWLLLYHGVRNYCNGYIYCMGGAMMDIDEPWKVKYRARPHLLAPELDYEVVGDTSNVIFPCATLHDSQTGKIAVYYGCADTVVGLAFAEIGELVGFIKSNSE